MQERLQKIISRAGIASRRHAEDLIRSGQVRVNGIVITELGAKADPERDRVEAAGQVAQLSDTRVYLLMNKPPEVVSTLADPEGRRTLRNFLVGVTERVFPVGRLDYAVGGAVFLTNDGDLASRMLKASPSLPQTYWVKVKGRLSDIQVKSLANMLHGKMFPLRGTHAAGKNPPNPWYEVQITGVRRDLLRKNLLGMGHPVEKMRRMKLASLDADSVQEGHYRQLTPLEVAKLVRTVEIALKEHKPVPKGFKPRREWRPRRDMVRKATDGKGQVAPPRDQMIAVTAEHEGAREQSSAGRGQPAGGREHRVVGKSQHSDYRKQSATDRGHRPSGREQGGAGRGHRPDNRKQSASGGGHRQGGREHSAPGRGFRPGSREQNAGDRGHRPGDRKQGVPGGGHRPGGREHGAPGRGHRPAGRGKSTLGRGKFKPV